ncbi:MAG: cyclic nucleotide-binding domain-containing protein [Terracidiphilus sp.]|jgi:CRP-like cAMP-binding protein
MKSSFTQERSLVQLDPTAFLADPELIRTLSEHATPIVCDTDRVLFQQDDSAVGLYILHEGEATISMTSIQGQAILSVQARGGSLLGLPGLVSNQPYSLTAVAHAGARVSFLGRSEFTALMESNPTLAFKILQVLAAEVRSARHALY